MGVTIHYNGTLASKDDYRKVVNTAMKFAEENNLPFLLFGVNPDPPGEVADMFDGDWICPIQGICIQPDPMCDPLIFEFDQKLSMEHFCKTQFADISVHLLVIELLRKIQPFFKSFEVTDEGEYWVKKDLVLLQQKRELINRVIKTMTDKLDEEGLSYKTGFDN